MTRVVLTRQQDQNRPWVQRLQDLGIPVLDMPLLTFEMLPAPAPETTCGVDWILFTSPRGVLAFVRAGLRTGGCRVGGLGHGTVGALTEHGIADDLGFAGRDGAELATHFCRRVPPPATVLLPGPAERVSAPLEILADAGFTVRPLPLYRTLPVAPATVPDAADIIFFCSPSAVRAFADARAERPLCVAIGETTAAACRARGFPVRVARHPDLESMLRAAGLEIPNPAPERPS
ncbi:hypothetical protein CSB20_02935 [bacterium DOLZORAL124_64_63]|nr:MAG: hypothetical protein CSB20_02935 [bacterium DOLZORAL124_64_63]